MASEHKLRCGPVALILFLASSVGVGSGQVSRELHRTFAVSPAEPVILQVDLLEGDLRVAYSRDGVVSICVAAQNASNLDLPSLSTRLVMAQSGNHLEVWEWPGVAGQNLKLTYTIDVPYRIEVHASVRRGKQTITGILGPVTAKVGVGDIDVSYVSLGVAAQAQTGNLNFEVVGGRVEAQTGRGNISCQRAPQGISAETQDGNISLAVVGPSVATVKQGTGTIDASGVRGTLAASTDDGGLHVKAVPHDDWTLNSVSGTIRVELPRVANFDLDAVTNSGDLTIARDDLEEPSPGTHGLTQKANGGGKHIVIRSEDGSIVVT